MPHSFPNSANPAEVVGQTPWSARVPLDPPLANGISRVPRGGPTRASAADQVVRPTINAERPVLENYVALGCQAC